MSATAEVHAPDLLLTEAELVRLTAYTRPSEQLAELHRQGFHRARRNRFGQVVLERAHYDAVCARGGAANDPSADREPELRPFKR